MLWQLSYSEKLKRRYLNFISNESILTPEHNVCVATSLAETCAEKYKWPGCSSCSTLDLTHRSKNTHSIVKDCYFMSAVVTAVSSSIVNWLYMECAAMRHLAVIGREAGS